MRQLYKLMVDATNGVSSGPLSTTRQEAENALRSWGNKARNELKNDTFNPSHTLAEDVIKTLNDRGSLTDEIVFQLLEKVLLNKDLPALARNQLKTLSDALAELAPKHEQQEGPSDVGVYDQHTDIENPRFTDGKTLFGEEATPPANEEPTVIEERKIIFPQFKKIDLNPKKEEITEKLNILSKEEPDWDGLNKQRIKRMAEEDTAE